MKVKNIAFSGFMAAILMGAVATPADAVSVASKEYVDARETAINTNLTQNYLTTQVAGETYVTKTDAEAFQKSEDALTDQDVADAITGAVTNNVALAGALADKEDTANKVREITDTNKTSQVLFPTLGAITSYTDQKVADIVAGDMKDALGAYAKTQDVADDITEALNAAKEDATTKANTAEKNAKDYADATFETAGTAQGLIDGLTGTDGQVGKNAAAIAQNAQDIADNAGAIAQNAQAIAGKADAATTLAGYGITDAYTTTQTDNLLGGKVNATGQTANQIMVTDADGKVVTVATISAAQVSALSNLATAQIPESCVNDEGTLCALTLNTEGKYAWTVITEPTTQNP